MNLLQLDTLTEALEINENYNVNKISDEVYIIDNFFKNFEILNNIKKEIVYTDFNAGLLSSNHYKNRSFEDLRAIINIKTQYLFQFKMQKICFEFFNTKCICEEYMNFTATRWKKKIDEHTYGECPHLDQGAYTGVVYFTDLGSTNIYEDKRGFISPEAKTLVTDDYLTEFHLENYYDLIFKIPAKLNRILLFNGSLIHGAGFTENEFLDEYREIGIFFMEKI